MTKFGIALAAVVLIAGIAVSFSLCAGPGGRMMGGMHGGGLSGGQWHHIQMHGLPRNTSKMSFDERGRYIFQATCQDCHGKQGRGGVKNPNYEQDTVPALDELADSMGLFRPEHADAVLKMLEEGVDPASKRDDPPFRGYARFVAQYDTVRDTIVTGREAAKKDPSGRSPEDMPAWGRVLSERDVDAVIAHVIRLYDFPEPTEAPEPDASSFP